MAPITNQNDTHQTHLIFELNYIYNISSVLTKLQNRMPDWSTNLRSLVQTYVSFGKSSSPPPQVCVNIPDDPKTAGQPTHHKPGGYKLYKRLSLFVCIPMIALMAVNTFVISAEHPHRPEFVEYEYMRKRDKRFPWGDGTRTLFHNPHLNALKDGYEDVEENAMAENEEEDGNEEN